MKTFILAAIAALLISCTATAPSHTGPYDNTGHGPRANNPSVPGATGYTIVPGDNSSVAGDGDATEMERTGTYGN
jgi:hypothetical protein